MRTITAANSQYAIAIAGLYTAPQLLQGYAADDAFSTETVKNAEVVQGIDGNLSGGFVFEPSKQMIHIMPDSPSLDVFNNWSLAMKASREVLIASATIIIPSIGMKYVLSRGFLTGYRPIPDVKKLVQAIQYEVTWNTIVGARI